MRLGETLSAAQEPDLVHLLLQLSLRHLDGSCAIRGMVVGVVSCARSGMGELRRLGSGAEGAGGSMDTGVARGSSGRNRRMQRRRCMCCGGGRGEMRSQCLGSQGRGLIAGGDVSEEALAGSVMRQAGDCCWTRPTFSCVSTFLHAPHPDKDNDFCIHLHASHSRPANVNLDCTSSAAGMMETLR